MLTRKWSRAICIGEVAKLDIPHLATRRSHGQESEHQCKLASPYLTIYLGLLTRFTVPLRLRPHARLQNRLAAESGIWNLEAVAEASATHGERFSYDIRSDLVYIEKKASGPQRRHLVKKGKR